MKKFLSPSLLCLLILSFPRSSPAQNVRPFAVQLTQGTNGAGKAQSFAAPLTAASSSFAFNTDFHMFPSVLSSLYSPFYGFGPQKLQLGLGCLDLSTGNPIPNAVIESVVPQAETDSGGHLHDTNRPAGSFDVTQGITGPNANNPTPTLPVVYSAPEASGIVDMVLTCSPQGGTPVTGILTIGIEIPPLEPAISGSGLSITTTSNMHGNNNGYATPEMSGALTEMAIFFGDTLTQKGVPQNSVPIITINALSLPQGGLFDYQVEWNPPHHNHRFGIEADVRILNLNKKQRQALESAFEQVGFTAWVRKESPTDPTASHWHLFAPGAPPFPSPGV